MREGMLHIRDVEGPKKTGSVETRLEAMEQQVFKCQGMVERGLNANHMMITEFTNKHKMDANDIGKHLSRLYDRVDQLQGQIYDLQNQNFSSPKPQPCQMEYEAGLVVSGPMTQLEAEIWIQNMENHIGSNLISRKYEVEHALQYFTQSAAIWWKMHHVIQGFSGAETWDELKNTLLRSRLIQKCYDNPKEKTCACKISGEIGHTQEEHKDGCTHCEENHPAEECPSSQVTCFLCEGTTHYPAQCHIYPKVQQVVQQQKEAMKETLKNKILEEPVMNKNIEDRDGQGLTRFFSNACYSCGEEGHYSQDFTKRSQEHLGNFPTEKVVFYPLEIEELAKIKESGKKKKYPRQSQISADIDLSHLRCYKCMEFGHHKYMCSGRKPETQGAKANTKTPRDWSELICFRCKEARHFASDCPQRKKAKKE
ncbi:40S ribosomal protein S5-1 [Hordeum vulgare]|nr:40S ribosomal protein S5-1 [Hordeum vulgare]